MSNGYINLESVPVNIKTVSAPESNFIRVMAAMAVPPDANICDVRPAAGLEPMAYNKYDAKYSAIATAVMGEAFVDYNNDTVKIKLKNVVGAGVADNASISIFAGGTLHTGTYDASTSAMICSLNKDTICLGICINDERNTTKTLPVWAHRVNGTVYMDYEADWSGGPDISNVPSDEYDLIDKDGAGGGAKVSVGNKSAGNTSVGIESWKRLLNATGISISPNISKSSMAYTFTMGIITSGMESTNTPLYWQTTMGGVGSNVHLRIYPNIHGISHKRIGLFPFNKGQGHGALYEVHGKVTGTFSLQEAGDAVVEYVAPKSTFMSGGGELQYITGNLSGALIRISFAYQGHNTVHQAMCYAEGNSYVIKIRAKDVPDHPQNAEAMVVLAGYRASIKADSAATYMSENNNVVVFKDSSWLDMLSKGEIYSIAKQDMSFHDIWWDGSIKAWVGSKSIGVISSATIEVCSGTVSSDMITFANAQSIYNNPDDGIYPNNVHYYRLNITWDDIMGGIEKDANICNSKIIAGGTDNLIYGIYAVANYEIDAYGEQKRKPINDQDARKRYYGIYGRHPECKVVGTGSKLYNDGVVYVVHYPPAHKTVLLTNSKSDAKNNVKYYVGAGDITFDFRYQALISNPFKNASYAQHSHAIGDTTCITRYKSEGTRGNNYRVKISVAYSKDIVIEGASNETYIYVPTNTSVYDMIYEVNKSNAPIEMSIDSGDGKDEIEDDYGYALTGGGNDSVEDNDPTKRSIGSIYAVPGYMLNASGKIDVIETLSILPFYLHKRYGGVYSGGFGVVAIDRGGGIELYVSSYNANGSRHTLVDDIKKGVTKYSGDALDGIVGINNVKTNGGAVVLHKNGSSVFMYYADDNYNIVNMSNGTYLSQNDEVDVLLCEIKNHDVGTATGWDGGILGVSTNAASDIESYLLSSNIHGFDGYIDLGGEDIKITGIEKAESDNITIVIDPAYFGKVDNIMGQKHKPECRIVDIVSTDPNNEYWGDGNLSYSGKYVPTVKLPIPKLDKIGVDTVPLYVIKLTY